MTTSRPPEGPAGGAEERRAREALAAAGSTRAPEGLRRRIEAERAGAEPEARRRRRGLIAAALVIAAALAASAVFILRPPASGATVIGEVADLHARAAARAVPRGGTPALLALSAEGVPFPRLEGWRTAGFRVDRVRGREVTTVFYRRGARRIGYSVVSGEPLDPSLNARVDRVHDVLFASLERGGRLLVSFERLGRTCVISGRRVRLPLLLSLAAATGDGSVRF